MIADFSTLVGHAASLLVQVCQLAVPSLIRLICLVLVCKGLLKDMTTISITAYSEQVISQPGAGCNA
jgi:hypothetical protein